MNGKTILFTAMAMIVTFAATMAIVVPMETKTVKMTEYIPVEKLQVTYDYPWLGLNDSQKNAEIKQILAECDRQGLDAKQACSAELEQFKNWCVYKYNQMPVCVDVLRR